MKVLLSAYACEPDKGSEPAVGWNWVRQVSRFHEVWVITRANNREPIEKALAKNPLPNAHFIYFDLPHWARFWKRGQRGAHLYYYLWQLGAYFAVRKWHQRVGFDLTHHVTFGQYWTPSFVALLPIPFVWGPVGGGESAPASFRSGFSLRGRVFEVLRDLARNLARLDPLLRFIARRSRFALATTEQTAKRLKQLGAQNVLVVPQFAMTSDECELFAHFPVRQGAPFRVISIGRLIHWKGHHLALRAFASFHQRVPDSEYWVVNSGSEMGRLQALAKRLGVGKSVVFWGKLPTLEDVYSRLAECDVLIHAALHEAFGNVCLEAMAAGRPVICLDLGGPALQVTEETGIKVPAICPEQAVRDLAAAMVKLATDPALGSRMGDAARERVKQYFAWDKKGELALELYNGIAARVGG